MDTSFWYTRGKENHDMMPPMKPQMPPMGGSDMQSPPMGGGMMPPPPPQEQEPDSAGVKSQVIKLLAEVKKITEKNGLDFEEIIQEFSRMSGKPSKVLPPAKTEMSPRLA